MYKRLRFEKIFPKLLCRHALKNTNAILSVINPNEKKESIIIAKFSGNRKDIALLCVLLELLWIKMKTQEASTITTDFSKKWISCLLPKVDALDVWSSFKG